VFVLGLSFWFDSLVKLNWGLDRIKTETITDSEYIQGNEAQYTPEIKVYGIFMHTI